MCGDPTARAQATIRFAEYPNTSCEVPDDDGMWLGSSSPADHVRRPARRVRGGVDGSGVAARSAALPTVASRRRHRTGGWWFSGDRRRGLHGLALRRRGGRLGWLRGARGGASRHAGGPGRKRTREDRSQRQSAVARATSAGPVAGVADPADDRVGVAATSSAVLSDFLTANEAARWQKISNSRKGRRRWRSFEPRSNTSVTMRSGSTRRCVGVSGRVGCVGRAGVDPRRARRLEVWLEQGRG